VPDGLSERGTVGPALGTPAADATVASPGTTAPPLGPPGSAPAQRRLDPRLRAFLVSLIVLAAGAALGTGGFLVEQSRATWRPQVAAAGSGWRISTSHGQRLGAAALGGDKLVWDAGAFTLLTDLATGRSRLLGAAALGGNATEPAASDRYAVWMETQPGAQAGTIVWGYDMDNGRRMRLDGAAGVDRSPVVAGSTAVWASQLTGGQGWLVQGVDIPSGRALQLATTPVADDLVAGGTLAAWVSRRTTVMAPPVITVADLAGDLRREVAPYTDAQGGRLIAFTPAGRSLLWARSTGEASDQIVSFDVDTGAARVVASAPGVRALAAAGDLIVWAEGAPAGGGRVVGLRLGTGAPYVSTQAVDAPFVIAEVSGGAITDVYAGAGVAAWRVRGALFFDSYLQTAEVP
jgi:hypothetical protein